MAQEQQLPEIKLDASQLYREEIFTDRKAGHCVRLVPVKTDGSEDASRPVLYSGQNACTDTGGAIAALAFELEASSLGACNKFPDAVKIAIRTRAIEEAREMRRGRLSHRGTGRGGAWVEPSGGGASRKGAAAHDGNRRPGPRRRYQGLQRGPAPISRSKRTMLACVCKPVTF
jgi:hypothetical protein